jgi:hypothetical protein
MIKRLTIIIALVMILAVPNISAAFENNFRKSLCDFPFFLSETLGNLR